jgi:hypothetical protein
MIIDDISLSIDTIDNYYPNTDDFRIRSKNHPNMEDFVLTIFIHFWIWTIAVLLG